MTIYVDTRESEKFREMLKNKVGTSEVREVTLTYGDIEIVGNSDKKIIIERKTIFDIFKSVDDRRLWMQLGGLEKYENYKRVVIIEGVLAYAMRVRKDVNKSRWMGIKASIIYGWNGISIIETRSMEETVWLINLLNKKVGSISEGEYFGSNVKKEGRDEMQELIDVVTAIEGIGEKKAEILLKKYKTIENIAKQDEQELVNLLGKVGKAVYGVFRRKFERGERK